MTHTDHAHDWDDPDRWTKEIHKEPGFAPITDALLDAVGIRPGHRLLDLACGLGATTAAAAARGADALGIDSSHNRTTAARDRFPHVRFLAGDASSPPAGPWDAVICRFGAHHLSPDWARAARAVLAPGGRVAIAEWPPKDERDRDNGMREPSHWVTMLERAGFEDVKVRGVQTTFSALAGQDATVADGLSDDDLRDDREVLIISAQRPTA